MDTSRPSDPAESMDTAPTSMLGVAAFRIPAARRPPSARSSPTVSLDIDGPRRQPSKKRRSSARGNTSGRLARWGSSRQASSAARQSVQPDSTLKGVARAGVVWGWKEKAKIVWRTAFSYADRISDFIVAASYFADDDTLWEGASVLCLGILPAIVMVMLDLCGEGHQTGKGRCFRATLSFFQLRLVYECYSSFREEGTSIKHSLIVLVKAVFESFPQSILQVRGGERRGRWGG